MKARSLPKTRFIFDLIILSLFSQGSTAPGTEFQRKTGREILSLQLILCSEELAESVLQFDLGRVAWFLENIRVDLDGA
jgi:hypothetical protein